MFCLLPSFTPPSLEFNALSSVSGRLTSVQIEQNRNRKPTIIEEATINWSCSTETIANKAPNLAKPQQRQNMEYLRNKNIIDTYQNSCIQNMLKNVRNLKYLYFQSWLVTFNSNPKTEVINDLILFQNIKLLTIEKQYLTFDGDTSGVISHNTLNETAMKKLAKCSLILIKCKLFWKQLAIPVTMKHESELIKRKAAKIPLVDLVHMHKKMSKPRRSTVFLLITSSNKTILITHI